MVLVFVISVVSEITGGVEPVNVLNFKQTNAENYKKNYL